MPKHCSYFQRGFTCITFTLFLLRHSHFMPCKSLWSFKYRCALLYLYYKFNTCIYICVLVVIWIIIVCTNGFCLLFSFHSHCSIDDFVNETENQNSFWTCSMCVCMHVCVVGLTEVLVISGQNGMNF